MSDLHKGIIDAEVHLLHPEAQKVGFMKGSKEPVRLAIHEHPDFPLLEKRMDLQYLLQSMDSNGIEISVIMGMPWHDAAIQTDNNAYIAECVKGHPGKFRGLYIPHLQNPDKAANEISNLDASVFLGIKIIPSWQNRHLNDRALEPVFDAVVKRNMFMMVHTDHPTQSLCGDTPYRLLEFLKNYPDIRVLAPHLGGLVCIYALDDRIKRILKNVVFVTSVSKTMQMVKYAAEVNSDNLVFGSDFPFNHCHDQGTPLKNLRSLDLPRETQNKILTTTASYLFGG